MDSGSEGRAGAEEVGGEPLIAPDEGEEESMEEGLGAEKDGGDGEVEAVPLACAGEADEEERAALVAEAGSAGMLSCRDAGGRAEVVEEGEEKVVEAVGDVDGSAVSETAAAAEEAEAAVPRAAVDDGGCCCAWGAVAAMALLLSFSFLSLTALLAAAALRCSSPVLSSSQ